jgi:hypothetical protein
MQRDPLRIYGDAVIRERPLLTYNSHTLASLALLLLQARGVLESAAGLGGLSQVFLHHSNEGVD